MAFLNFSKIVLKYRYRNNFKTIFLTVNLLLFRYIQNRNIWNTNNAEEWLKQLLLGPLWWARDQNGPEQKMIWYEMIRNGMKMLPWRNMTFQRRRRTTTTTMTTAAELRGIHTSRSKICSYCVAIIVVIILYFLN